MSECLILDLDGTLADCSHRMHYIETSPKDWKTFFAYCYDDPIIEPVYELIKSLKSDYKIVITTSRPESNRYLSNLWLEEKGIKYDMLLMRKTNDFRKSPIIKSEMVDFIIEKGYIPKIAFEDREDCVEMFINRGIFTIHIPESNIRGL